MLLKSLIGFFSAWINLLCSFTTHGEFCFHKREYVLTALAQHLCMFIWSKSSQPALSRKKTEAVVWINCHLGLVTLNVMYYRNNNDNKWSQHTRGQAFSQSIQTHTLDRAKMPKCCRPNPQVLSDLHLIHWLGQALSPMLQTQRKKKEYPSRFLLHCHSSAAPLAIKDMIKSDKVSGKWRESRQRPQPHTLVNYSKDSK